MRRAELAALSVYDLDAGRSHAPRPPGKGNKDRMVQTGERALAWLVKYQGDVRAGPGGGAGPGLPLPERAGLSLGIDWLSIMVVAVERADLLAELDAESAEEGEGA